MGGFSLKIDDICVYAYIYICVCVRGVLLVRWVALFLSLSFILYRGGQPGRGRGGKLLQR